MTKADTNHSSPHQAVNEWLGGLSKESKSKVSLVCSVLVSVSELSKASVLRIPHEAFEKSGIDSTSVTAILDQLWKRNVIDLMDFVEEGLVSSWNRDYEQYDSFCDSTMINIDSTEFEYLCSCLSPVEDKTTDAPRKNGLLEFKIDGHAKYISSTQKEHNATFRVMTLPYKLLSHIIKVNSHNFTYAELEKDKVLGDARRGADQSGYKRRTLDTVSEIRKKLELPVGEMIIVKYGVSLVCDVKIVRK